MLELRLPGGARRALALCGAALAVAALNLGEARADGPPQLKSRIADACIDAPSAGWYAPVVINPCNGADTQRWNLTPDRRLESAAFPGQCLSLQDDGWAVRLLACWTSRRWTIEPDGHIKADAGGCLAAASGIGPGAWVTSRMCSGAPDEGWDLVP